MKLSHLIWGVGILLIPIAGMAIVTNSFGWYFWLFYFGFTLLGLILKHKTPEHIPPEVAAKKIMQNFKPTCLLDFDEALEKLAVLQPQCKEFGDMFQVMNFIANIGKMRRDCINNKSLPYLSPKRLSATLTALELQGNKIPDKATIEQALHAVKAKFAPETLAKSNLPRKLKKLAKVRIENAENAAALLANAPEGYKA